jgi:hypothetical protein
MEIDDEIIPPAPQAPSQLHVRNDSRGTRGLRRDDHLVEVRVPGHHRRGRRLDQIRQVPLGICPLQRAQHRSREDDVADQAETDEENLQ